MARSGSGRSLASDVPAGSSNAHFGFINRVCRFGDRLVSWGNGTDINVWSLSGKRLNRDETNIETSWPLLGVVKVEDRFVSWTGDGAIRFWSSVGERLSGGEEAEVTDLRLGDACLGVLPIGDQLVSWGHNGRLRFWSTRGQRLPGGHDYAHEGLLIGGVLAANERLVSWGLDGAIRFWSHTGEVLSGGGTGAHEGGVRRVMRAGNRLVSCGWGGDRIVKFWSLEGNPLGCWIQPDFREVRLEVHNGELFLLHPEGPRNISFPA